MKPVIGIPISHYIIEGIEIASVWSTFLEIIETLNGIPLIIPSEVKDIDFYMNQVDGLLLTGGKDIYPPNFSIKAEEKSGPFDLSRDELEIKCLRFALEKNLPVFGICRGAQLIAAYFKCDLYQDLDEAGLFGHTKWVLPDKFMHVHTVKIEKNSLLSQLSSDEIWKVNSGHHQGIKKLALGMKRLATTPDGLIEAFQHEKYPFVLGVQWHPEVLQNKETYHRDIFELFINQCMKESRNG